MVKFEGPTSVESGRWIRSPGYQLLHDDGINTNRSSIMFIMVFVLSTLFLSQKNSPFFFSRKRKLNGVDYFFFGFLSPWVMQLDVRLTNCACCVMLCFHFTI